MSSTALADQVGSAPAANQSQLEGVYRKVTWRLIPFLMFLWILAWIDRVNIGFAKLTMLQDLQFSETIYGLGAGIFFLGYFFFEVPSNMLLEKIGARSTIARITIGWSWNDDDVVSDAKGAFDAGVVYPGQQQIQIELHHRHRNAPDP